MADTKTLNIEETSVFKPVLVAEVDKALESIKALKELLSDPNFILGHPEEYSFYQRLIISAIMAGINDATDEIIGGPDE